MLPATTDGHTHKPGMSDLETKSDGKGANVRQLPACRQRFSDAASSRRGERGDNQHSEDPRTGNLESAAAFAARGTDDLVQKLRQVPTIWCKNSDTTARRVLFFRRGIPAPREPELTYPPRYVITYTFLPGRRIPGDSVCQHPRRGRRGRLHRLATNDDGTRTPRIRARRGPYKPRTTPVGYPTTPRALNGAQNGAQRCPRHVRSATLGTGTGLVTPYRPVPGVDNREPPPSSDLLTGLVLTASRGLDTPKAACEEALRVQRRPHRGTHPPPLVGVGAECPVPAPFPVPGHGSRKGRTGVDALSRSSC